MEIQRMISSILINGNSLINIGDAASLALDLGGIFFLGLVTFVEGDDEEV